ncbi:MAG: SBBP repeat-containing protein [Geothermobacteraceae bacterium]
MLQAFFRQGSLVLLLLGLLAGCAGRPAPKVDEAVFWPPPPNPPRVQFLLSIDESVDVTGTDSGRSLFGYGAEEKSRNFPLIKPYGVTVADGLVYLCEMASGNVYRIDFAGKTFSPLPGIRDLGKMTKPINLTRTPDGRTLVADIGRREIMVYDAAGEFVRAFGKKQKLRPSDIAADDRYIFVLDMNIAAVRVYDLNSYAYLETIGQERQGDVFLSIPTNLHLSGRQRLHVTNVGNGKVISLDRDGHILQSFGRLGDGFGQFGRPKGIATDEEERIYVVDAAHQNVQIFDPAGDLLMFFGEPTRKARPGEMKLPAGIEVTNDPALLRYFQPLAKPGFHLDRLILVTNHFGPHRLAIYGMGTMEGVDYTIPEPPENETKPAAKGQGG